MRARSVLPLRDGMQQRRGAFLRTWVLLLGLALLLGGLLTRYALRFGRPASGGDSWGGGAAARGDGARTLVVYVFRNTDGLSIANLVHFLKSIEARDRARYLVALDPTVPADEMPRLPPLPARGEFLRPPPCFEMGVVGWVLHQSGRVSLADHEHFVWVTSGVRGPLLPAYERRLWHTLLTERLTGGVRLAGPTISCAHLVFDKRAPPLLSPHVQHQVAATDRVGRGLIKAAGAFDCHTNWLDNMRFGEIGASAAVLRAGWNLDCLMKRYQRVNWRRQANWGCNARVEPHLPDAYDGVSLNPLEVLFARLDGAALVLEAPPALQADAYSRWEAQQRPGKPGNVSGNAWVANPTRTLAAVLARPKDCFDAELYRMASPVEFAGYSAEEAYEHFLAAGFYEGRPYAFLC